MIHESINSMQAKRSKRRCCCCKLCKAVAERNVLGERMPLIVDFTFLTKFMCTCTCGNVGCKGFHTVRYCCCFLDKSAIVEQINSNHAWDC